MPVKTSYTAKAALKKEINQKKTGEKKRIIFIFFPKEKIDIISIDEGSKR